MQSKIISPFIGATDVNKGVLETIGVYAYVLPKEHLHRAATLGLAGSVPTIVGASTGVLFNAKNFVQTVRYTKKLKRNGHLTEDQVRNQLSVLDDLDKKAQRL